MAKVTGPLMSLDASGTVGHTAVFSKWKGRNYVRLRVTPKNVKSNDQAKTRTVLGLLGKALSFILFPTVANGGDMSQFYADDLAHTPAGQSWISYAIRQLIGTGLSTWDTVSTAWGSVSGTVQGYFTTGAASLGLADFSLPYGTFGVIDSGEQLYHLAVFAVGSLEYAGFAGGVDAATSMEVTAFVTYCNVAI